MYSCGPPHMDVQEWDDQHEHTYSNYVRTQDVTLKTCRRRWMIGRNGERGSRISALAARHDDDDIAEATFQNHANWNTGYEIINGICIYLPKPSATLLIRQKSNFKGRIPDLNSLVAFSLTEFSSQTKSFRFFICLTKRIRVLFAPTIYS